MDDKQIYHIHFGPGKLGLGLVVPTFRGINGELNATDQTIVVARKNNQYKPIRQTRKYDLRISHKDEESVRVIDNIHLLYSDRRKDRQELYNYFTQPKCILITTAVARGIYDVLPQLLYGLERRWTNNILNNVYIVACENPPFSSDEIKRFLIDEIRKRWRNNSKRKKLMLEQLERVIFLNTVVDRICCVEPQVKDGKVVVSGVEKFSNWYVLGPKDRPNVIEELTQFLPSSIALVSSEEKFKFIERRKLLLVNGSHYILALYALGNNIQTIQDVFNYPEEIKQLQLMQAGFVLLLNQEAKRSKLDIEETKIKSLLEFKNQVNERLQMGPSDNVNRVLHDLTNWKGEMSTLHTILDKNILRAVTPVEKMLTIKRLVRQPEYAIAFVGFLVNFIKTLQKVVSSIIQSQTKNNEKRSILSFFRKII